MVSYNLPSINARNSLYFNNLVWILSNLQNHMRSARQTVEAMLQSVEEPRAVLRSTKQNKYIYLMFHTDAALPEDQQAKKLKT